MNVMKRLKAGMAAHQEGRHVVAANAYRDVLKADPENADALHFIGVLVHETGDPEWGIAAVRKSLAVNPNNVAAHSNLGNMLLALNQPDEAMESYRAALALDPLHAATYRNVGVLLRRTGQLTEAIRIMERAAEIEPESSEAWHNLGITYIATGDIPKAAKAFEKCVELGLNPRLNAVWHARTLCAMGREDVALRHLELHLERHPDDPIALHHVAAIRGESSDKVPEDYVRQHFDSFAGTFDDALSALQYRAPELVAEAVADWHAEKEPVALAVDLGCGTGLCGPLIRGQAEKLIGVDLSARMLAKAADTGAYEELHEDDLVRFLEGLDEGSVGLAISADTLNYLGDLGPLMAALARALEPGAALVGTIEEAGGSAPESGYRLQNHGRYCHSRAYLEETAGAAGLTLADARTAVLRREAEKDVAGLILTITRPG